MDSILNDGCVYRERLGNDAAAYTLLSYLSQRYRHSSADEWAARIDAGYIQIDDQRVHADTPLQPGSELIWQRPPWYEPAAPCSFEIIHEDADLLVVAKPAGLPTLPGANFLQATLLHQVQRYAADAVPVHRLGRWTSGLVVCAKQAAARGQLMQQWSSCSIGKRYRALASGHPAWQRHIITTPIGRVAHPLLGTVHAAHARGKSAHSEVHVLEQRADRFVGDVWIATGRPHQIRIHLAAAGHPLVGDPLYLPGGVPAADTQALPGDPGYVLHAAELRLQHPRTGDSLKLECMPPVALRIAEETLASR